VHRDSGDILAAGDLMIAGWPSILKGLPAFYVNLSLRPSLPEPHAVVRSCLMIGSMARG